jgi:HlyD family secretion protein
VLLELDPALTQAQLQQSTANVSNAKASLELALANEARMSALHQQEYVSRQELDQAVQALKSAQAQLAVAEAQAERDRTNLAYTVIRSPVSGVVVSREVDIGQTVAASFQTPTLFKIAQDLSKMQIDSNYAEADVGSIHVGQQATFRVDAFPDRVFNGVVKQVRLNPTTQQNVVTYNVVISVDNTDQALMPGMTAYVSIIIAQRKDALLVPNAALRFRPADAKPGASRQRGDRGGAAGNGREGRGKDKGGAAPGRASTVYVIESGVLKPVRLTAGITDNRFTEVLDGELKEGAQVVVEDTQPPAKPGAPQGVRLF